MGKELRKFEYIKKKTKKYDGTVLLCPAFKELNLETMKKYGIKLYSVYDDLEKLSIQIGKRKEPLCKQIYGFKGDLTEAYDEGQKNENFQR